MNFTRHRLIVSLLALVPALFTVAKERSNTFRLQIASDIKLSGSIGDSHVVTDAQIQYAWQVNGHDRTLRYEQTSVRAEQNGKETMNVSMDKDFFQMKQDGKDTKVSAAEAPAQLKTMLADGYTKPLCQITVDENGKETSRKDIAAPGAKDLIDNGAVANATMMHMPYYTDRKEWQAPAKFSMGNGGYASGDLTFTRGAADENGVISFNVTGTLSNDSYTAPSSPVTQKDAKYVVKGKESYDPKIGEWVHGEWTADVSLDMIAEQKPVGAMRGTMQIKMHRVDDAKK